MNSLAVVNGLPKSGGGVSYGVCALCDALSRQGVGQFLLNVRDYRDGEDQLPDPALVPMTTVSGLDVAGLRWSLGFKAEALEICRREKIQLLHNHGLWSPANHGTAVIAEKLGIPMVTTPHGSLTRWAFQHKSLKKKLAWGLYQKADLEASRAVHVTAEDEAKDLRELGLKAAIALIPIGIDIPTWRERKTEPKETRTALFVSRIHPKKGLLTLVEAWAAVRPVGWRMRVVGPDYTGYRPEVERAVKAKGLEKEFIFEDAVYDAAKWELYWDADVFILPTFSENFGLVIPEALACGVPVITTQGTPWKELEERSCGWWIPLGVDPLVEAIRKATSLTDGERSQMGLRGRQLVEEKYTWESVAKNMKLLYEWVLGGGNPPPFIMLD
jgi:glycosyltransferase involved in cell wall biosynthesis